TSTTSEEPGRSRPSTVTPRHDHLKKPIDTTRPPPQGGLNMIREHFKRLASMAVLGASLATLSSCSSTDSTQPEGDISFIEENWEIEAPESAETVEYYSTDSDFQGGREDVYVISMAESDRSGYWDE